ncbi:MAG: hypothetical protein MN733_35500 [Nitrososphaera sp.]|nr:hypothetical protein [Nitrososphaera sp.]
MPHVTLKYNLPDEEYEYEAALHGRTYRRILEDFANTLRSKVKYGNYRNSKRFEALVEDLHSEFWSIIKEAGVPDP